jgi:hypothetical protein
VRELRTLRRTRAGLRVRSVQGRLSIEMGDEDEAGGEQAKPEPPARSSGFRRPAKSSNASGDRATSARTTATVFHPLAYRSVVANWPIDWREQWGRRANDLEETGLSWRDAEAKAFVEIWHKIRATNAVGTSPADIADLAGSR